MWYRQRTLLAAVIFSALCYKVAAEQLDTAPNAVDDLYNGCKEQAQDIFIRSGLLKRELNRTHGFQEAWSTKCPQLIPRGLEEHTAALMVFAKWDNREFQKVFNDEVEMLGVNVSTYENFNFKSLHFLLMDSMKEQKCINMYRQSDTIYKAQKGSRVRFGRFTTVNRDHSLMDIYEGTLFNITSCFFASLGICNEDEDMALISPSEEFTVEDVKQRGEYIEIVLKHSKLVSWHNCYHFSRSSADVSTLWLVLVLVGFSLFFCNS